MESKIDAFILREPAGVFVLFMLDIAAVMAVAAALLTPLA